MHIRSSVADAFMDKILDGAGEDWYRDAACVGVDILSEGERVARDLCPGCPVRDRCRELGEAIVIPLNIRAEVPYGGVMVRGTSTVWDEDRG